MARQEELGNAIEAFRNLEQEVQRLMSAIETTESETPDECADCR